jgi:hypothetical protein
MAIFKKAKKCSKTKTQSSSKLQLEILQVQNMLKTIIFSSTVFSYYQGVDVMITISAIFDIFGETIGVFLKNQYYDQILAQLSFDLSKKCQFVATFFGENIFKS